MAATDDAGYVLDCSFTLPCYLPEVASVWAKQTLQALIAKPHSLWVPALWFVEFSNGMKMAEKRQRITTAHRQEGLATAQDLPLRCDNVQHNLAALSALADAHGLTAYDAVYFELARRRKLTLVSLDSALLAAARKAGLKVLTAPTP